MRIHPRWFSLGGWIFISILLLRLFVLARLTSSPFLIPSRGDMHFYDDWAQRIWRGESTDHHAFYGLPLYPYLLAFIYKIFGYSPFVPGFLQACLDAGTGGLIYQIAHRVFAERAGQIVRAQTVGAIAALGWAFFVPAQAYSVILMPTSWFIFVFWFVVWRIIKNEAAPNRVELLLLGLLVGIAALGVATILFLPPLILAALYFKTRIEIKKRAPHFLIGAAILLSCTAIGTSPAWLHNYVIARDPVFLSAHSGINFWIGNNPDANGYPRFPPGLRAGQAAMLQDSITGAENALGRPLKRSEVSAYWSSRAKNYIENNFAAWLRLLARKLGNFWSAFQYDDLSIITNLREQRVILPGLYFGIVAALAIPGIFFAWRVAPASRWVAAAIGLHLISLLPVFVTERYRMAVVPGLLIFAVFGLSILWENCAAGALRPLASYFALLLLATTVVAFPQKDPSLWALDAYNSGWQALESGNLRLAEKKLQRARAYVPTNPEINFALANLRLAQNNIDAAKAKYLETLALDPHHAGAFNNLGVIALRENDWDHAANCFSAALRINPRNAKTHFLLAQTLLAKNDRPAARHEIDEALKLDPKPHEFAELKAKIENASPH